MVFLKEFLEEADFEKSADNKIMQNYTVSKSSVNILALTIQRTYDRLANLLDTGSTYFSLHSSSIQETTLTRAIWRLPFNQSDNVSLRKKDKFIH